MKKEKILLEELIMLFWDYDYKKIKGKSKKELQKIGSGLYIDIVKTPLHEKQPSITEFVWELLGKRK